MHTHEGVLGPDGFCNSDKPMQRCGCTLDGLWGPTCETRVTQVRLGWRRGLGARQGRAADIAPRAMRGPKHG